MMGYIVIDIAKLSFIRKPFSWSVFLGGRARSVHISKTSGLSHLNSRFTGAHYHTSLKVCIMVSSVSPGTKAMQGSWRIPVCRLCILKRAGLPRSRGCSTPAGTALLVSAV